MGNGHLACTECHFFFDGAIYKTCRHKEASSVVLKIDQDRNPITPSWCPLRPLKKISVKVHKDKKLTVITEHPLYNPPEVLNAMLQTRKKMGYSQDYMALKLRVSQNAYSKWESGESPLSIERLYEIANVFGMVPGLYY